MKYKVGDEVVITKDGVHKGRKVIVTERNKIATKLTMNLENYYYYTVQFLNGETIVINEEDVNPHKLVDNRKVDTIKCQCGGDKLAVPHHYNWCPKGG